MTHYQEPRVTDRHHIAVLTMPITHQQTSRKQCINPNCHTPYKQSIGQFFDKRRNPTKTFCKSCRGQ